MPKEKVNIYFGGPTKKPATYQTIKGTEYHIDGIIVSAIHTLNTIPFVDLMEIMGVSHLELLQELEDKKASLSDKLLSYIKDIKWKWKDTQEEVEIDNYFLEDFLDQDVTRRSVYRRLRDRRISVTDLNNMIAFFESECTPITNNQ